MVTVLMAKYTWVGISRAHVVLHPALTATYLQPTSKCQVCYF
jgi:hypothetical protein